MDQRDPRRGYPDMPPGQSSIIVGALIVALLVIGIYFWPRGTATTGTAMRDDFSRFSGQPSLLRLLRRHRHPRQQNLNLSKSGELQKLTARRLRRAFLCDWSLRKRRGRPPLLNFKIEQRLFG